jgi:hypothetical protein
MSAPKMLVIVLLIFAAVFLASCNPISPEARTEVLTQQNYLRGWLWCINTHKLLNLLLL